MPNKHEEVWVCPLDDASNRSIAEVVQASDADFAFGVLVDGKPCNLIRVESGSVLRELRASRARGTVRFREVRQASLGARKRDVTIFTASPARPGRHTRKPTAQDLVVSGFIRDPAGILGHKNGRASRVRS